MMWLENTAASRIPAPCRLSPIGPSFADRRKQAPVARPLTLVARKVKNLAPTGVRYLNPFEFAL
jgi:hypothetical protein